MSQPMLATPSHPQHLHHPQQTQPQQQQRDNNDIEDFLNILIDDNTQQRQNNNKSPQQLSPCQQQPSPSFNIPQQPQRQPQHFGGGSPIPNANPQMQLATSPPTNVPEVKIKCEDNSASDYPHSDGDGFIDDMSPFHSGVSSPGSSCSAMSGPGSPILMDSNSQPPFNQNYLTPDLSRTIESWMDGHVGATYSTQSSDRQGYELYMVLVNIL